MSILSSTMSVYAGSFMTLNCSFQLSNAVDSLMTVTIEWKKDNVPLTNSGSRWVSEASLMNSSSNVYLSQVIFSPVQLGSDDGVYSCEAVLSADTNFVLSAGLYSINNVTLNATGTVCM